MKPAIIGLLALVNVFWITTAILRSFLHISKDTALYISIVFVMAILYCGYRFTMRRTGTAPVESGE